MSSSVSFTLSDEAIERIAERAAEIARERLRDEMGSSPWLTRRQAAMYLSVPASRLEKDRRVPCRRWDGRVLYNRAELDAWLERFREAA